MAKACTSCGISLEHESHVSFECPECGDVEIHRCLRCRQQGNKYRCENCGFEGP